MNRTPPCVVHEDDDLLVVLKPAGWYTHAPDDWMVEGIYEWLRDREPRWAGLANLHRLDKDTSGLLVFAKTVEARRSLAWQFSGREVDKRYLLVTAGRAPATRIEARARLARRGKLYVATDHEGDEALTVFEPAPRPAWLPKGLHAVWAHPVTGRTHQIRVQSAALGFPVLGDPLYGDTPAPRLHLHAERIAFRHPRSGEPVAFESPADFRADTRSAIRAACIDRADTNAWRLAHGAADGWPGARIDLLGDWLLHQSETPPEPGAFASIAARGVYHKALSRQVRRLDPGEASPRHVAGEVAPERFEVRENGVRYELSFAEGYSTGLFLDQRDNRRRLLAAHVASGFPLPEAASGTLLNVFAYTCAFSVCAALAGATTTSLDLSRKYLDWGRRNFELNALDPARHDFIYGDAFDWMRRLAKKERRFDIVVLDPPTFSQSKEGGVFRAEADYERLVTAALGVLAPGGVLLASTNAARLAPEAFVGAVTGAVQSAGRRIAARHYVTQPPDFPASREDPAYLKTLWLRTG